MLLNQLVKQRDSLYDALRDLDSLDYDHGPTWYTENRRSEIDNQLDCIESRIDQLQIEHDLEETSWNALRESL